MAGGDVLGIATSGLLAFQRALSTTSHNIANVNTPGYSRQSVNFLTQVPQASGAGFVGNGVLTDAVRRNYDEFLNREVRSATSSAMDFETLAGEAGRIADLLGDSEAGLGAGLNDFFSAVQDLANDPTSIPTRQALLSEAESLASRFQYLDQQLSSTRSNATSQMEGMAADISTLSTSIAELNGAILRAQGQGGGSAPNDLLDQRDALVQQLSEYVAVETVAQDDGTVNVFIGNGQSLVTGTEAGSLAVTQGKHDVADVDIVFTNALGASVPVTQNIVGGKLGGMLNFRDQVLDPAQNALGRIAIGVATAFNAQHELGVDLDGNPGGQFFEDITTSSALSSSANTGDYQLSATITDVSKLTASDYRLDFNGANYTLRRLSDNASLGPFAGLPINLTAQEGFTINIDSGTTLNAGDSFLIRPTRQGAGDISVALTSVNDIAAASPVLVSEATNSSGTPTNAGDASFGSVAPVDSSGLPLAGITFVYDDTLKRFDYSGDVSGSINYNAATDAGTAFTVNGISFSVTGTPADGDSFVMSGNPDGKGDNRNALALAGLQTTGILENGSTDIQSANAQLIGKVASQTRQAQLAAGSQERLLRTAEEQRNSVSGVNLEEEAANLIRFQQAYEAVAQVISVADTIFQTLLGAVRR